MAKKHDVKPAEQRCEDSAAAQSNIFTLNIIPDIYEAKDFDDAVEHDPADNMTTYHLYDADNKLVDELDVHEHKINEQRIDEILSRNNIGKDRVKINA